MNDPNEELYLLQQPQLDWTVFSPEVYTEKISVSNKNQPIALFFFFVARKNIQPSEVE